MVLQFWMCYLMQTCDVQVIQKEHWLKHPHTPLTTWTCLPSVFLVLFSVSAFVSLQPSRMSLMSTAWHGKVSPAYLASLLLSIRINRPNIPSDCQTECHILQITTRFIQLVRVTNLTTQAAKYILYLHCNHPLTLFMLSATLWTVSCSESQKGRVNISNRINLPAACLGFISTWCILLFVRPIASS